MKTPNVLNWVSLINTPPTGRVEKQLLALLFQSLVLRVGLSPDVEGISSNLKSHLKSIPGHSLASVLRPINTRPQQKEAHTH